MSTTETPDAATARRRKLIAYVPLAIFLALAALFLLRLGAGDISRVPSALIGRPVPQTVLPPCRASSATASRCPASTPADFTGAVTRAQCVGVLVRPLPRRGAAAAQARRRQAHPHGRHQHKDQPDNARRFLGRYGNPFVAVGVDANGRASIEWGVYGVPETFVVGRDGRIAYKLIGPITPQNLETALKPQIEKALAATPSS